MNDQDRRDDEATATEASSSRRASGYNEGQHDGQHEGQQHGRPREEHRPQSTLRGAPDRADTMKDKLERAAREGFRSGAEETGPDKSYETWTKKQLYQRARELRIANRSLMNKRRLIEALRRHG